MARAAVGITAPRERPHVPNWGSEWRSLWPGPVAPLMLLEKEVCCVSSREVHSLSHALRSAGGAPLTVTQHSRCSEGACGLLLDSSLFSDSNSIELT